MTLATTEPRGQRQRAAMSAAHSCANAAQVLHKYTHIINVCHSVKHNPILISVTSSTALLTPAQTVSSDVH
jgi:hypothetical protein